ncbi:MAG: M14 family zinc carboxypeptidase, partial [Planctomycetota bacterium]
MLCAINTAAFAGEQKAASPTSAEVERHVRELAARHPALLRVETAGETGEQRPILAVTATDPQAGRDDRQHVLIVAGQHGEEESGRMLALGLLDWLATAEAAPTRARQKIVVMPNVNPDGAERNAHSTPLGIQPNLDHSRAGPKSPEGRAVEKVAFELQPELFVDMHARGGAGCSYGMVLYPRPRVYTEDDNLLHALAAEMAAAGEQAGLPHATHPLTWPGWGGDVAEEASTTLFAYRNFKSLVFITETPESDTHCLPAELRVRSGLALLKTLLAHGNRRHAFSRYDGYPCGLMGMNYAGIAAVGKTAAARRASRVALWKNADGFEGLRFVGPEERTSKRFSFVYRGPPVVEGAGLQVRAAGRMDVEAVTLDGRALAPSETDGYGAWQDGCSTFVVVVL